MYKVTKLTKWKLKAKQSHVQGGVVIFKDSISKQTF